MGIASFALAVIQFETPVNYILLINNLFRKRRVYDVTYCLGLVVICRRASPLVADMLKGSAARMTTGLNCGRLGALNFKRAC